MSAVTTPHDALFKKFLTDPEVARDFLESHLSKKIKKLCDFSSLVIENASFIEDHLRQHAADVLYHLKIAGKDAYIYVLVEAQSSPDKLMPFRFLRYEVAIMKRYLDAGHKKLYAGRIKYCALYD
jgi:recombination-promoting nuclease RpnB